MPVPRAVAVVIEGRRVLVMKRFVQGGKSDGCANCALQGVSGPPCAGHHYAVLPGGHVEEGETVEVTALRELHEETTLRARIERLLWTGSHDGGRPATYFLMADVVGTPVLSGPEAAGNRPDNHHELRWVTAEEFDRLNLRPVEIREPLARLLRGD